MRRSGRRHLLTTRHLIEPDRRRFNATTKAEAQNAARTVSLSKLDKLDDASLFEEKIDRDTYERQRDHLREEMTLDSSNTTKSLCF